MQWHPVFVPFPLPPSPFAPSRETLWPQSQKDGRKNHRKSQKDTVPIRRSRRTDTPPADDEPARQTLVPRVGIGIGIGIGIENSRTRTGLDPDTPRHLRPLPIRGSRPGGPPDSSPARQRWVPSPHRNPAPAGRQPPSPRRAPSFPRPLQNPTPRNTRRPSRKASKPPRDPSSPIRNPPDSTGSKSTRSHFNTDVFAERQAPDPALLRVFASPD